MQGHGTRGTLSTLFLGYKNVYVLHAVPGDKQLAYESYLAFLEL